MRQYAAQGSERATTESGTIAQRWSARKSPEAQPKGAPQMGLFHRPISNVMNPVTTILPSANGKSPFHPSPMS